MQGERYVLCGWLLLEDVGCLKWEPPVYRIGPLNLLAQGFVFCRCLVSAAGGASLGSVRHVSHVAFYSLSLLGFDPGDVVFHVVPVDVTCRGDGYFDKVL